MNTSETQNSQSSEKRTDRSNYSFEFCGTEGVRVLLFVVACSVGELGLLGVVVGSAAVAALTDISSSLSIS